ncbi:DUF2194 domain-containing protein [Marinitoga arctica]
MKKLLIIIFILSISFTMFGKKDLLLLYKKSEQYGEYLFQSQVIPILKKYDINYELKNVEEINFYEINYNKYFGIISWYYSTNLPDSGLYLRQLSNFVEDGGFFFFFNNLGVSADLREINNLLNKIGMHYMYGFKEINNFEVVYDKNMFLSPPSTKTKKSVEKYIVFNEDNIFLKFITPEFTYPTLILSEKGGGALLNSFITDDGNVILNIENLILKIIKRNVGYENKVLIIDNLYDKKNYLDSQKNFEYIFKYAKIPYEFIDVRRFYNFTFFDLIPYKYIIWNTDSKFIMNKSLNHYLENKGTLIFSTDIYNTPWRNNVTLKELNISKIIFDKALFPLGNENNGNTSVTIIFKLNFNVNLLNDEKVLSYFTNDNDEKSPAIWYRKEKNGYIGYISPFLIIKNLRGLILQSILEMSDISIAGLLNSYTFYIDDFPLPSYNIKIDNNKGEIITDDEYYYNIWWPSIKKFSEDYNIKYTFITPLSYNGVSSPPFDFSEFFMSKNNNPFKTMKEIDNLEFELGLHGYNHTSLTKENWPNYENIILSLNAAQDFLNKILDHPVVISSYVAPNNIIDDFGVKYLLKSIPTIKTIGTSYEGQDEFSEYEITNNFVLIIPRSTYGYYPIKRILFTTINTLANFGAFQHFIHPDDLFSKDRNPDRKTWDEMYKLLENFYNTIKSKFPWLRNHSASEAYPYYFDYLTQNFNYFFKENNLTVIIPNSSIFPKYFMIRSKKNIREVSGGKIIHYYRNNNLYIIEATENKLRIKFLGD